MLRRISRFDLIAGGFVLLLLTIVALTAWVASRKTPPVSGVQIVYLAPTEGPFNIWRVDPAQPDQLPVQVTFSETGIFDFSVSPDGRRIAYSEAQDKSGSYDLIQVDLRSGATLKLTNCAVEKAVCTTPAWRPDGSAIAYQRRELNDSRGNVSRIWLLDLTHEPFTTFPLFTDATVLGTDPKWSSNGKRLTFYDLTTQSVLIYNFAATDTAMQLQALPDGNGSSGALSPDGSHLVFPELQITTPTRAIMRLANLDTGEFRSLTADDELTEDRAALWDTDGKHVIITRRYLDERFTPGDQVYEVDSETGTIQPLIFDPAYQHSSPSWSPDGTQLVLHRYLMQGGDSDTTPEIWLYTLKTKSLIRLVSDGFYPLWVKN
jgi:Tol biopolymer transport system component